jgi:hypothetical protein
MGWWQTQNEMTSAQAGLLNEGDLSCGMDGSFSYCECVRWKMQRPLDTREDNVHRSETMTS